MNLVFPLDTKAPILSSPSQSFDSHHVQFTWVLWIGETEHTELKIIHVPSIGSNSTNTSTAFYQFRELSVSIHSIQ